MIMFALRLTPQADTITCPEESYGCGGQMRRIPGAFDRFQPVYECTCGNRRTLPPVGGWVCPSCGNAVDEIYGDSGECLDCFCRRAHTTLTLDEWAEKHLRPVHNPGCLGASCKKYF